MNKKQADLALKMLFHMGMYFDNRYVSRRNSFEAPEAYEAQCNNWGIPSRYYLGNTPLNESLIYLNKLIPMYKKKYDIEKLTFITLTDGSGNYPRGNIVGESEKDWEKTEVFDIDGHKFTSKRNITVELLEHIKKSYGANVIGFYIVKRVRRWDLEKYITNYTDYSDKIAKYNVMRKQMTKDKAVAVDAEGYHKYFILDGKKLDIENFDMSNVQVKKGTTSELKRVFGKSMANRLVSRVVLNKFIQEVA
tara:strand:- start:134 stop:880 length:747 start_codon:yes stop_codon:yes gene_type:complete